MAEETVKRKEKKCHVYSVQGGLGAKVKGQKYCIQKAIKVLEKNQNTWKRRIENGQTHLLDCEVLLTKIKSKPFIHISCTMKIFILIHIFSVVVVMKYGSSNTYGFLPLLLGREFHPV